MPKKAEVFQNLLQKNNFGSKYIQFLSLKFPCIPTSELFQLNF